MKNKELTLEEKYEQLKKEYEILGTMNMKNIQEITGLQNHIKTLQSSKSWRIAAFINRLALLVLSPFRFAKLIWKVLKKLLKVLTPKGFVYVVSSFLVLVKILFTKGPKRFIKAIVVFLGGHFRESHVNEDYTFWLQQNALTGSDIKKMKKHAANFEYKPKISIIMPVFNVEEKWLLEAVKSLDKQIYDNWELCIVDDASTAEWIKPVLKNLEKNKKIKITYLSKNSHISIASNEALKLATGEFIGLMDNDDSLSVDALYEVVKSLNGNRKLDFIYSDEDKSDEKGRRSTPFFKPDWSPELAKSFMYTPHFCVYRKSVIDKVGGFRIGFEGSQDYDLLLRVMDGVDNKNFHHIPKILYHWRMVPGSTAAVYSAKSYAADAAKKSIEEHLKRNNIEGEVLEGLSINSYRIKYKIVGEPKISIIIPTYNQKDLLENCIESIEERTTYKNYEIIVVNNNSNDPETLEYFKEIEKKHKVLEYAKPFNYSAINNFAVEHATGEHLLFLNNDTEVTHDDWLESLLEHSQQEKIGAVGAKLLYPNGTIQHAGVVLGLKGVAGHDFMGIGADDPGYFNLPIVIRNVGAVTGACLMMKRRIFDEIGGFNEDELKVAFNDIDLCLKALHKGYRNVFTPFSILIHHESVSRGADNSGGKLRRFLKEINYMQEHWGWMLHSDPYYNPNLSLVDDYSIEIVAKNEFSKLYTLP